MNKKDVLKMEAASLYRQLLTSLCPAAVPTGLCAAYPILNEQGRVKAELFWNSDGQYQVMLDDPEELQDWSLRAAKRWDLPFHTADRLESYFLSRQALCVLEADLPADRVSLLVIKPRLRTCVHASQRTEADRLASSNSPELFSLPETFAPIMNETIGGVWYLVHLEKNRHSLLCHDGTFGTLASFKKSWETDFNGMLEMLESSVMSQHDEDVMSEFLERRGIKSGEKPAEKMAAYIRASAQPAAKPASRTRRKAAARPSLTPAERKAKQLDAIWAVPVPECAQKQALECLKEDFNNSILQDCGWLRDSYEPDFPFYLMQAEWLWVPFLDESGNILISIQRVLSRDGSFSTLKLLEYERICISSKGLVMADHSSLNRRTSVLSALAAYREPSVMGAGVASMCELISQSIFKETRFADYLEWLQKRGHSEVVLSNPDPVWWAATLSWTAKKTRFRCLLDAGLFKALWEDGLNEFLGEKAESLEDSDFLPGILNFTKLLETRGSDLSWSELIMMSRYSRHLCCFFDEQQIPDVVPLLETFPAYALHGVLHKTGLSLSELQNYLSRQPKLIDGVFAGFCLDEYLKYRETYQALNLPMLPDVLSYSPLFHTRLPLPSGCWMAPDSVKCRKAEETAGVHVRKAHDERDLKLLLVSAGSPGAAFKTASSIRSDLDSFFFLFLQKPEENTPCATLFVCEGHLIYAGGRTGYEMDSQAYRAIRILIEENQWQDCSGNAEDWEYLLPSKIKFLDTQARNFLFCSKYELSPKAFKIQKKILKSEESLQKFMEQAPKWIWIRQKLGYPAGECWGTLAATAFLEDRGDLVLSARPVR